MIPLQAGLTGSLSEAALPIGGGLLLMAVLLVVNRRAIGVEEFEEFATARGVFGSIPIATSYLAAFFVGASYTAFFGAAVNWGYTYYYSTIYSVFGLVVLYMVTRRIWVWGDAHDLTTQADGFAFRYDSELVRQLGTWGGMLASFPWLIMEMWTLGFLWSHASYGHLPFWLAMAIGATIIGVYVALGGMRGVVTSHLVVGATLILGSIVFGALLIYTGPFGSYTALLNGIQAEIPAALTYPGPALGAINAPTTYWTSIIVTSTMGAFVWPWVMNRIYAAESPTSAKAGGSIVQLLIPWIGFIGFLGVGYMITLMAQSGLPSFGADNPQQGWLWISDYVFGPVGAAVGVIVALALVVGTVSALVHFFGTTFSRDVIRPLSDGLSSKQETRYAQLFAVVVIVAAYVLANLELPLLIFIALTAYQFIIQLFPAQILGFIWPGATKEGVIVGLVGGLTVTGILTYQTYPGLVSYYGFTPGVYGVIANLILFFAVSLITTTPDRNYRIFDEVEEYMQKEYGGASQPSLGDD